MADQEQDQGGEAPTEDTSTPTVDGAAAYSGVSEQEIADGKAMAILSYAINIVGLPFWIIPLIMRNNEFSLFHAKQCLMIWLVAVVGSAVAGLLMLVCIGALMFPVIAVFFLVVDIMGIIYSVNGQFKPLPLIGPYAEKWFAGIRKAPEA